MKRANVKADRLAAIFLLGFAKRQSVLIGVDGRVARFFDEVDPATHSARVLAALAEDAGMGSGQKP